MFPIVNETYIFFYEIHVVGFKISGNIFVPHPPFPLDVVFYVKRVRSGGGGPHPELIPEYASASNALIFYKQSTVKKFVNMYNMEETCPI